MPHLRKSVGFCGTHSQYPFWHFCSCAWYLFAAQPTLVLSLFLGLRRTKTCLYVRHSCNAAMKSIVSEGHLYIELFGEVSYHTMGTIVKITYVQKYSL